MAGYFHNSLEHVLAEAGCAEAKVLAEARRARHAERSEGDNVHGFYIAEAEIDAMLSCQAQTHGPLAEEASEAPATKIETDIRSMVLESKRRGIDLRLERLGQAFCLSRFEIDTVLLCLLPELDMRFQKLYGYLQDDATKKTPTVDLVLRVLCPARSERIRRLSVFSTESPLIRYGILRLHGDHPSRPTLLLGRLAQLDQRVLGYLLDSNDIDADICKFVRLTNPDSRPEDLVLEDGLLKSLASLAAAGGMSHLVCYLFGPDGAGKRTIAGALCAVAGKPLLVADLDRINAVDQNVELLAMLMLREAVLQASAIYFGGFRRIGQDSGVNSLQESIIREIEKHSGWVFLAGESEWQPEGVWRGKQFVSLGLGTPSYSARRRLWVKYAGGPLPDNDLDELAGRFRLGPGQIVDAVSSARTAAALSHAGDRPVGVDDLFTACRKASRNTLNAQTKRIEPRYHWADIVLARDQVDQLHEICSHVRYSRVVYGDWGFDLKLSSGKGLNALFAGPSGTGKTMAAEIMANELGLDLYKIDLSAVVSKYIGETEKNLRQIFEEGQASNAILFFDEADALFGKRSEVRDSHDRYANIEIAYLLQRMEEYEGIVILASNLRKNMDDAFTRRMHYIVEFAMPEEPERLQIWQKVFPSALPLSGDVDLSFLAKQFKISGGNIKNIALNAAFLAAGDGGCVNMTALIRATRREYQKMGKLCTAEDFLGYFELVKS